MGYIFVVVLCYCVFFFLPQLEKERNSREDVSPEIMKGTAPSPEKEDRYYSTRGSTAAVVDENGHEERGGSFVLPKLLIALSSKEKEEDFMAMKGCKLPQRPKKRAKMIQRSLLLLDVCVSW
uniref:Uncharacterized protein n=1 Tax=Cucumis melo TaxID=3656 RepID=A0A9I9E0R4_CUCME